jgi:hypothetical protein
LEEEDCWEKFAKRTSILIISIVGTATNTGYDYYDSSAYYGRTANKTATAVFLLLSR